MSNHTETENAFAIRRKKLSGIRSRRKSAASKKQTIATNMDAPNFMDDLEKMIDQHTGVVSSKKNIG